MCNSIGRQRYLMNPFTGSLDTEENWRADMDSWQDPDRQGPSSQEQFDQLEEHPFQLHCAARFGNLLYLEHLLGQSGKIDERDDEDNTPLHIAVAARDLNSVNLLINAGADIHARENQISGMTPLHLAAGNGFTEVGLALLAAGADPMRRIDNGADPSEFNQDGATCIDYAEAASDDKLVQEMHLVVANRQANQLDAMTVATASPPHADAETLLSAAATARQEAPTQQRARRL